MKNLLYKLLKKRLKTGQENSTQSLKKLKSKQTLPYITIGETVIFPNTIAPIFISGKADIKAYENAMEQNKDIVIGYPLDKTKSKSLNNTYKTGTLCHILQVLKLPDGTVRILVEGYNKVKINNISFNEFYTTECKLIIREEYRDSRLTSLIEVVKKVFNEYSSIHGKVPEEVISTIGRSDSANKLIGNICFITPLPYKIKMKYFLEDNDFKNLENIAVTLKSEIEILKIQQNLQGRVKKNLEKTQREYFLNEQIKEIHKELGKEEDPSGSKQLLKQLEELSLNTKDKEKLLKDAGRLNKLQPMSPEAGILRTYLETVVELPWNKKTVDEININKAKSILNNEHYKMLKAKDRILDFIAVRQFDVDKKSPVLCFVGPPGTGKTSLGKSVANALGREFGRISLGGVKDEAEIRGHRKTYIGALPGKIIQAVKKTGVRNPVILLDEIDKISADYKGDPASALLEVLDPEQNHTFTDHYIELPFDLSDVLFIATANSLNPIPAPLMDRMEVIEIQGYTEIEKVEIAKRFIIPKQLKSIGLNKANISFTNDGLLKIIRKFTRESGVRNLNRNVATVLRKIARLELENYETSPKGTKQFNANYLRDYPEYYKQVSEPADFDPSQIDFKVTGKNLNSLLGDDKIPDEDKKDSTVPGLSVGLAWTQLGGTVLPMEITLSKGSGKLILTGQLGDVMKESAQIAFSYVKSHYEIFGVDPEFDKDKDIHIHAPEGAIQKDGPSAGITMTSALISALKGVCINKSTAMTGEITLTGQILPIGGVKEKVLAAARNGSKHVLLPEMNRKDIKEIPKEVQDKITFHFHSRVDKAILDLFPKGTFN